MASYCAQLHTNATDFLRRAEPFLLASEAKYSLMLGVVLQMREREAPAEPESNNAFATVTDARGNALAASMWTPPYKMILTEASDDALDVLVDALWEAGLRPPAVAGPPDASRGFAERYIERTRGALRPGLQMRIHKLTSVQPVPEVAGAIRPANADDTKLLARWADRFTEDTGVDVRIPGAASIPKAIASERLFVWDDGGPVSMAAWTRPTSNSVTVNGVYTPPRLRGRGYATACVAALSKHLLAEGRSMLCLFTDASNPTSNAIYKRIGYEPVSDWHDWWFDDVPTGT